MNAIRCVIVIVVVLTFVYCVIVTGILKTNKSIISKRNIQLQKLLNSGR